VQRLGVCLVLAVASCIGGNLDRESDPLVGSDAAIKDATVFMDGPGSDAPVIPDAPRDAPGSDAPTLADAPTIADAPNESGTDASLPPDAGTGIDAGSGADASTTPDAPGTGSDASMPMPDAATPMTDASVVDAPPGTATDARMPDAPGGGPNPNGNTAQTTFYDACSASSPVGLAPLALVVALLIVRRRGSRSAGAGGDRAR
jgi:uncharacterized protein (TIGR03382 family)